jgi:hypothetical protein
MWISIYLTDDLFLETLNKMKNSFLKGLIFFKDNLSKFEDYIL